MTESTNPFEKLFHSRKFWLAVYALAQTIAGHYLALPTDIISSA